MTHTPFCFDTYLCASLKKLLNTGMPIVRDIGTHTLYQVDSKCTRCYVTGICAYYPLTFATIMQSLSARQDISLAGRDVLLQKVSPPEV